MALAEEEDGGSGSKGKGKGKGGAEAKEAWTELLKPVPKPKCTVHGVECIEKTVSFATRRLLSLFLMRLSFSSAVSDDEAWT